MACGTIFSVKTNKTKCISRIQRMNEMVARIQNSDKEKGIDRKRQKIEENKCRKLSMQMDHVSETTNDNVSRTKEAAEATNEKNGKQTEAKKRKRTPGTEQKEKETQSEQNKYVASTRQKGANMISEEVTNAMARGGGKAHKKTHGYGCRHYGVMDLKDMSTLRDFHHYNSKDRWLIGKRCSGPGNKVTCTKQMTKEDMKPEKGSNIRLYYCDMGIRAANYTQQGTAEETKLYTTTNVIWFFAMNAETSRRKHT
jgi:hypothetical protein